METKVINIIGGPGVGKSTIASGLFWLMKSKGYSCELALEYVKELVWEGRFETIESNQAMIIGEQEHRLNRLEGKVDYIITDASLIQQIVYTNDSNMIKLEKSLFNSHENINFLLKRKHPYIREGRVQSFEEALIKDKILKDLLDENQIPYIEIDGDKDSIYRILEEISK